MTVANLKTLFAVLLIITNSACTSLRFQSQPDFAELMPSAVTQRSLKVRHLKIVSGNIGPRLGPSLLENAQDHELEDIRDDIFATGIFSEVEVKKIDSDQRFNIGDRPEHLVEEGAWDKNSDLQMNFYEQETRGHSPLLLLGIVWAGVHFVSLGLIPVYFPWEKKLTGDLRDDSNRTLYSFNKVFSAQLWSWSPFLFTGKSKPISSLTRELEKNCVHSVIEDAQKSGIF